MNDDKYYLGNYDTPPVKITVQTKTKTITQELPWDASGLDYVEAFYVSMIGVSFSPDGVIDSMKEFVSMHSEDNEMNNLD